MPEFEFIDRLSFLWLLPAIAILFAVYRLLRKRKLYKFVGKQNLKRFLVNYSKFKDYLKFILIFASIALLIVAYANPRAGTKLSDAKREGVDIVIGLDISYSMLAEDIKPNRLERAKQAIIRLLDKLDGDRVGLIVFAGRANVLFPLTTDYAAAKMFLTTIDPEFISEQGTAIGEAISIATEKFHTEKKQKKALLLISDGEDHEENAEEEAEKAKDKGFTIFTIAMGTPEGAPIPTDSYGNKDSYLKDDNGETVISRLHPEALQNIAKAGGGIFVATHQSEPDLQQFIEQMDKMDKQLFESKKYSEYESKYQYFLMAAIALLLLELLISKYKRRNA